jgi:hypothetical protein
VLRTGKGFGTLERAFGDNRQRLVNGAHFLNAIQHCWRD